MTDPQSPWQNPDPAQWQQQYPQAQSQYQVTPVQNAAWSMAPLSPVVPEEMGPTRPATITAAMWTWIAAAVLAIAVFPVLILGNTDALIGDGSLTRSERSTAELGVTSFAVFAGFGMLVAAAPYVAFAIVLRNGQNWSRILLTILGALGVLAMTVSLLLFAIRAESWQAGVVLCVAVIGLTVAAMVLMFMPASNRYVR